MHFNVIDSPTAAWTARQIVEAFPNDSAPRYLLRDCDRIYGDEFPRRVKGMGSAEVSHCAKLALAEPPRRTRDRHLPRELLDHAIVLNGGHLRRLGAYLRLYVAKILSPDWTMTQRRAS